ncbi:hypothetical protein IKG12_02570 [Candidatus Saccharibacteria bacterium]|nr:hypothetical protein [Candidatus Saccharibacteria bacterium]
MGKPTDPNAGTNRTNAVSRDNLMNNVELGYDGQSVSTAIGNVGVRGLWWSSTRSGTSSSLYLAIDMNGITYPSDSGARYSGRSVRCLLSPPVALVQDLIHCRMYIQAIITGILVGFTTRRCMAATGRLV